MGYNTDGLQTEDRHGFRLKAVDNLAWNKGVLQMNKKDREISVPLLAFTFFYTVTIYLLMIGFYFWHWHKED